MESWHALNRKLRAARRARVVESFVAASKQTFEDLAEASARGIINEFLLQEKRILKREHMLELLNQNGKDLIGRRIRPVSRAATVETDGGGVI